VCVCVCVCVCVSVCECVFVYDTFSWYCDIYMCVISNQSRGMKSWYQLNANDFQRVWVVWHFKIETIPDQAFGECERLPNLPENNAFTPGTR
jgi:hypothetical protein